MSTFRVGPVEPEPDYRAAVDALAGRLEGIVRKVQVAKDAFAYDRMVEFAQEGLTELAPTIAAAREKKG